MKKLIIAFAFVLSFLSTYAIETPEFPGGESALNSYLAANTRYPSVAQENGVEGIVVVGFLVTVDGKLTDLKVLKFVDPDLEKEALRVVAGMPAWIPAEKDGQAVEASAKVNVPFILE